MLHVQSHPTDTLGVEFAEGRSASICGVGDSLLPATLFQLDSEQSSARGFVFFRRHFLLAHKHSSLSLQRMADQ